MFRAGLSWFGAFSLTFIFVSYEGGHSSYGFVHSFSSFDYRYGQSKYIHKHPVGSFLPRYSQISQMSTTNDNAPDPKIENVENEDKTTEALKENIERPLKPLIGSHHHIAIRTRNIENAIKFYSLFGFDVECKFRAGPARAAWLTVTTTTTPSNKDVDIGKELFSLTKTTRIELIEVPSYLLQEEEGTRQRAIDLLSQETLLGINHFALDVTDFVLTRNITKTGSSVSSSSSSSSQMNFNPNGDITYELNNYIDYLDEISQKRFGKSIRVALKPQQKLIGNQVFEMAFLYDADGSLIELLYYVSDIELDDINQMDSGWSPWDGKTFNKGY